MAFATKSRSRLDKCPKKVLQSHTQNSLILHTKNCAHPLTEKAHFFGRMALWY